MIVASEQTFDEEMKDLHMKLRLIHFLGKLGIGPMAIAYNAKSAS